MKISIIIIITFILICFVSCKSKPVKTIFISTQNDTASGIKETKIYRLKKETINSDFDYSKLNNIDDNIKDTLSVKTAMQIFEPVPGQYKYYQFIATYKAPVCCDGIGFKDYHDILIIKTNKENGIIDAYQYTLEWAEPLPQYDMYKSPIKGLALTNNMDISKLKLVRTEYWNDKNRLFNEPGIIRLK